MGNNSIMIDLDDPRSGKIAEVMSSKTAKRILNLLGEKEMSPSEIASELEVPINTVTYNLKKIVDSGLIEKVNKSFWSVKGKKMELYKISNKKIIISPKTMIRGVVPAILGSVVIAGIIKFFIDMRITYETANMKVTPAAESAVMKTVGAGADAGASFSQGMVAMAQSAWLWFLAGALVALLIYLIWNLARRKIR